MSDIRVVCFDWGGVLLRICRTFDEGVKAAGLDQRKRNATDVYDVRHDAASRYQIGGMSDKAFFNNVSRSVDGLYTPEEVAQIHDAWLLGDYEGVGELIEELNDVADLETAVLSNTNERHWQRRLTDFPACSLATHQQASHLLGFAKPDPRIFTAFVNRVGVNAEGILYFDDLKANVDAAIEAGWQAELIDHTGDTCAQLRAHLAAHGVLD
ncbi:MAG: HAD-IA family hydrolase [Planctomycetota bacterium]